MYMKLKNLDKQRDQLDSFGGAKILKLNSGMVDGEQALISITLDQALSSSALNIRDYNDSPYKYDEINKAKSLVRKLNQEKREREIKMQEIRLR